MTAYYKFLSADGVSAHAGCKWSLPANGSPGEWMPEITEPLVMCQTGYHAVDRDNVLEWLNDSLCVVELAGVVIHDQNKYAASKARLLRREERWNARTARLFAADCAAFALRFSAHHDPRTLKVIEMARMFADGKATSEEVAATWDAARAGAATWDAARAAARAAAKDAALAAAWAATWDAARADALDAAWAAAGDDAWAALTLRFWEYVESTETPEPWAIGFDAIAHYKDVTP